MTNTILSQGVFGNKKYSIGQAVPTYTQTAGERIDTGLDRVEYIAVSYIGTILTQVTTVPSISATTPGADGHNLPLAMAHGGALTTNGKVQWFALGE